MIFMYCFLSFFGYNLSYFLDNFGILSGIDGVNYYGEAHLNKWNSLIHTIFMPITSYGFLLLIPNILRLNKVRAINIMNYIYIIYLFYYININLVSGILFGLIYKYVLILAHINYSLSIKTMYKGLIISSISLFIQEYFGHYLCGDIPSRIDGIVNAIIYANYYAINSFISLNFKNADKFVLR